MKILNGKRCRAGVFLVMMVVIVGVVYVGYFCPDHVCALSSGSPTPQYKTPLEAYLKGEVLHQDFPESSLNRDYDFDIEGEDVLVFLHIQKTGGTTFGRHLVRNVQLSVPCKCVRGRKRCNCRNSQKKIWLFSRYSTGEIEHRGGAVGRGGGAPAQVRQEPHLLTLMALPYNLIVIPCAASLLAVRVVQLVGVRCAP